MNDKTIFIDLQGFKNNSNGFIAKEVAIAFNKDEYINFIIKPPFDFKYLSPEKQKEAKWLTRNHHHLLWNDGSISFDSVIKFLKANVNGATIYVKGEEKRQWLEKIMNKRIFNIEDVGCINLKEMGMKYPDLFYCSCHYYGACALRNVILLVKESLK